MLQKLLCLFAIFSLLSATGLAQATSGSISGTVRDTTGAVLPGASISIKNLGTGILRTVPTDNAGRYSAPALGLGSYQVTASAGGFQTESRKGIELTVGREAVVNFDLNVGAVAQTLEVTGEAPLVESTTSTLGSLVDDRTVRELPLNGRSYDQLALLQPGVVAMGAGGTRGGFSFGSGVRFTVGGGRPNSNSFRLDGTDINDQGNSTPGGASGNNLGVDTIREFKILTNTYSAEYGRGSGAIITAVTNSGTNDLHGSLFEFLRNSKMDARNFFDTRSSPPPFKRNQYGGSFGGPIKKDKTFFFGGYEGLRQRLANTLNAIVPTQATKQGNLPGGAVVVDPAVKPYLALYPDVNGRTFGTGPLGDGTGEFISAPSVATDEDYFLVRADHQISDKHSVFGRYSFDDDSVNSPSSVPLFGTVSKGRRQYSTLQWTSVLSATSLNAARVAFNRTFQLSDASVGEGLPSNLAFVPGQLIGNIGVGAIPGAPRSIATLGTNNSTPRLFGYNLFEWADDFSYIKGRHSFKMGGDVERVRDNTSQNTSFRGAYTFSNFQNFLSNRPAQFEAPLVGENAYRGFRQTLLGFYAQDDFKLSPRFTLNLGLRWQMSTNPTESTGKMSQLVSIYDQSLKVTDNLFEEGKKNFEPRFGFAWQMDSAGKTVLRGGAGFFHSFLLPDVYTIQLAKLPPFFSLLDINNPLFPNGYTQLASGLANSRIQTLEAFNKLPAVMQYNLGIQQQFMKDTVVEVAYVGTQGRHLVRAYEADSAIPTFVNGRPFYPAGAPRRNPLFADVRTTATDINSHYNGLQASLKRKSPTGVQYQLSYTFSKAIDYATSFFTGDTSREAGVTMDATNWRADKGLSSQNPAHNFVANFSYPVPFRFQQRVASLLLAGWTVNGIGTFQTGQPFTVRLGFERSNDGNGGRADRPNLVSGAANNPNQGVTAGCNGQAAGQKLGTPDRYYDPCAFSLPIAGTYGNLGRDTVVGPGIANFDLSLEKNFAVREGVSVRFRAEMFNIPNHANFGLPNTLPLVASGAVSGSAGRIADTSTSSRQIQFGLKISF